MKYHIEKNTVQETLVIPLYGRRCARSSTRTCSAMRQLSV